MFKRRAAESPQRVLQSFGQRDVAFAAENDVRMLEAGIGEPEMIQPVLERHARDCDALLGHVGEIRQSHPTGFVNLAEDHLLIGAVHGPPGANAALESAARACGQRWMAPLHFFEDCHRAQGGRGLEHWHDLGIEEVD